MLVEQDQIVSFYINTFNYIFLWQKQHAAVDNM